MAAHRTTAHIQQEPQLLRNKPLVSKSGNIFHATATQELCFEQQVLCKANTHKTHSKTTVKRLTLYI